MAEIMEEILEVNHEAEAPKALSGNVNWSQTNFLENMLKETKEAEEAAKAVDQDLQDQDDELRALGISVVDQLSLERDVEAAVDKAVTVHARKQRLQMLKKEIQDVKKQYKEGNLKLTILSERLAGMRRRVVDPRQYFSVEKEMKNKDEQLKALKSREDYLTQKLSAAESNEAELDDLELEDGEIVDTEDCDDQMAMTGNAPQISGDDRERLIREGKMTPFGTVMTPGSSKTVSVMRPSFTQAEKRKIQAASKEKAAKENLISSGEMTPFGSVVKTQKKVVSDDKEKKKTSASVMTDFEKYLQDQIDRQKDHSSNTKVVKRKKSGDPNYGVLKRKKKPKEFIGDIYFDADGGDTNEDNSSLTAIKKKVKSGYEAKVNKIKSSESKRRSRNKDPIKMKVLHPKQKRQKKVALGTVTSEMEADQFKETPRRILSERVSFDGGDSENSYSEDNSDSEYVPSGEEEHMNDQEEWENDEDLGPRKGEAALKVDRPKRKGKKRIKSDDEYLMDEEMPKSKGRRSTKEVDDGNIDQYVRRIENWKEERIKQKHAKILRGENLDSEEEEEEGYEEFDGGYKVPLSIWNKLYKYQRTCVKWLWELHSQGCGGILGDEMGLGKTIQMISFLVGLSYSRLSERRQRWKGLGPVLIVCPATVLHQWVKEFHKWWPPFRVAVLHESGSFIGKRATLVLNINKYDGILITSYTGVHSQIDMLLQYKWHYIILDEGHKIRNPEAQITMALKRFETPHRLILSGSPIQNSLKELWSLFDFVFPGKLGTLPVFMAEFAVPITHGGYANASKLEVQTAFKCASVLRDTINPYLLRRMKNDVRNHLTLPDKNEQVLFCSLTEEQRSTYREYINGDQVKWIMGGRMKVFVGLINLRKICNHPDLYTGGPRTYDGYESGLQPELKYGWWSRSGKMHVLHSVLRLWSKQGHRVLLFTQSRQMMCILEKFLLEEDYCYLKMDGTTSVSSRQPLIEKFNRDPSYFVFLLTTRVGGLGVNLTGADRVVIFDPDWNPSTDSQARERAWRIGQMRHVTIYRLLTSGTIEEKIYHRQIFKQFLTNRVLKDPKQQRFFKTNDLFELFTLNEGDKEKTESSAIFAGTDSEIKVNVDDNAKESDDDDQQQSSENARSNGKLKSRGSVDQKGHPYRDKLSSKANSKSAMKRKEYKSEKPHKSIPKEGSTLDSASKLDSKHEKMKELAKMISMNIAKKSSASENKSISPVKKPSISESKNVTQGTNSCIPQKVKTPQNLSSSGEPEEKESGSSICLGDIKQEVGEMDNTANADRFVGDVRMETPNLDSVNGVKEEVGNEEPNFSIREEPNFTIKEEPNFTIKEEPDFTIKEEPDFTIKEETFSDFEEAHDESSINFIKEENSTREDSFDNESKGSSSTFMLQRKYKDGNNSDSGHCSLSPKEKESSDFKSPEKHSDNKHRKKHKKKDKHREKREKDKESKSSHKKGKKIDGERIDFLVKKRAYRKTEEEEEAERENAKTQDEYVLTKLFQKSGVHTALSHDNILSNNDPDYLLMEGEAERVAKEALKAVRASRARCQRPWQASRETSEPKKSKPKFGNKKNKIFTDSVDREVKREVAAKSKKSRMFNGGLDDDDDDDATSEMVFIPKKKIGKGKSSDGMSSSQLLARIHQRNKTVGSMEITNEDSDNDYDPDYPSTAAEIEPEEVDTDVQENIDLLADIRNFVAFQAEVDGSASTQEIIGRFRSRLPPEQTPFFKALLTKICDFHRKTSGEGIWSLKEEFR